MTLSRATRKCDIQQNDTMLMTNVAVMPIMPSVGASERINGER